MSAIYFGQIAPVWNNFSKFVHVLHNEHDYQQAVEINSHINVVHLVMPVGDFWLARQPAPGITI